MFLTALADFLVRDRRVGTSGGHFSVVCDHQPSSLLTIRVLITVVQQVNGPMGRPSIGKPLVDDWECLRAMVGAWESTCGKLDQYGMKHSRLFANLCNHGVAPAHLASTLRLLPSCSIESREARQQVASIL